MDPLNVAATLERANISRSTLEVLVRSGSLHPLRVAGKRGRHFTVEEVDAVKAPTPWKSKTIGGTQ